MASQMLAGKGFENVMNMAGGIKAWDNPVAMGSEEQGLALFDGTESPENTLLIAYSLEAGLRDFYLSMTEKVQSMPVRDLFRKLSDIEIKHQDRLFDEYLMVSGKKIYIVNATELTDKINNAVAAAIGGTRILACNK